MVLSSHLADGVFATRSDRTLLGAPGLTTRSKKLVAKGIATRSTDTTRGSLCFCLFIACSSCLTRRNSTRNWMLCMVRSPAKSKANRIGQTKLGRLSRYSDTIEINRDILQFYAEVIDKV